MEIYKNLPNDMTNVILQFDGQLKYRNGKYMNQIHKYDKRYEMIENIKKPSILLLNTYLYYVYEIVLFHESPFILHRHYLKSGEISHHFSNIGITQ